MTRVVIVVGEASGDLLAAGLIRELRRRLPALQVEGVTGPKMRAEGCQSWADYEPLAVMGLVEVVRHLPGLRRMMRELEERLRDNPPDLLIGVDAPDFNLRLLKRARRLGIATMQYVCPSVWAWRSGRVKNIAAACDHVLCLLPFEADYLRAHNITADFVGHPLADEIEPVPPPSSPGAAGDPQRPGPVVAVLPGSRQGEIRYLGPVFIAAMLWLKQRLPDIRFVSGAASQQTEAAFRDLYRAAGLDDDITLVDGGARPAMRAADVVLLASGTVTLEAMLMLRPMVVSYKISPITGWLLRASGTFKIDRFSLPNLLANADLVPELIQEHATGPEIGAAVLAQINDASGHADLLQRFADLGGQLRQSASASAAAAVIGQLERQHPA